MDREMEQPPEQSAERFIRKCGLVAGVCNFVLNPAFAWLGYRHMRDVPLCGDILIDTGVTCVAMSLLISLFVSADTRRAMQSGSLGPVESFPPCPRLLRCLPARPSLFGLSLGCILAVLAVPCLLLVFHLFARTSLTFAAFVLLKAVYTAVLSYVVARWVILRRLALAGTQTE